MEEIEVLKLNELIKASNAIAKALGDINKTLKEANKQNKVPSHVTYTPTEPMTPLQATVTTPKYEIYGGLLEEA